MSVRSIAVESKVVFHGIETCVQELIDKTQILQKLHQALDEPGLMERHQPVGIFENGPENIAIQEGTS